MGLSEDDHFTLALWAADCAERVLGFIEEAEPTDRRPHEAIQAARDWVRGEIKMVDARKFALEAHRAARGAKLPAAVAAARAAGHAAATAHVATHSSAAGLYALKCIAAGVSAEEAATYLAGERQWQWAQLKKRLRFVGFPERSKGSSLGDNSGGGESKK